MRKMIGSLLFNAPSKREEKAEKKLDKFYKDLKSKNAPNGSYRELYKSFFKHAHYGLDGDEFSALMDYANHIADKKSTERKDLRKWYWGITFYTQLIKYKVSKLL